MRPIDADATMQRLEEWNTDDPTDKVLYNFAVNRINEQPTIEERKTGKWIDIGSGQECSECHEIQYGYDNFRYFCAFCGADMRTKETDYDYERAVEQMEHDILFEPTFNQDDGSM